MCQHRNNPGAGKRDLSGVVIAFDLDNTLLDPEGTGYTRTLDQFFSRMKPTLGDEREAIEAYERVRSCGDALASCGLGNPIHERGHPEGLAVLFMLEARDAELCHALGIDSNTRRRDRATLAGLVDRHRATGEGDCESRLLAECRLRAFLKPSRFFSAEASTRANLPGSTQPSLATNLDSNPKGERLDDGAATRFMERARRIARNRRVVEWSGIFRAIERNQPLRDLRPFFTALTERGATPVLITEGRQDIQAEKVARLGLSSVFDGRLLTTGATADVPGRTALEEAIADRIDAVLRSARRIDKELQIEPDDMLRELWFYRSVLRRWATKSTWFYARCLHAMHRNPERPQDALQPPIFVPHGAWRKAPLHFVMVGDRYDKDVAPLIELLGKDGGLTVRLRQGKYGDRDPTDRLPRDRRPDHTFSDWASVEAFLLEALRIKDIAPIAGAPPLVPPSERYTKAPRGASKSGFEAIRAIATAGIAASDRRSREPTSTPRALSRRL